MKYHFAVVFNGIIKRKLNNETVSDGNEYWKFLKRFHFTGCQNSAEKGFFNIGLYFQWPKCGSECSDQGKRSREKAVFSENVSQIFCGT